MNNKVPTIALVGNAPKEKHAMLNAMLGEEELDDICKISLYGADGQPEMDAMADAMEDWQDGIVQGLAVLPMQKKQREIVKEMFPEEAENAVLMRVNEAGILTAVRGNGDNAASISQEELMACVEKVAKSLKRDFMILNPRVAVLSLNKEKTSDEASFENAVVAPAVSELAKKGVQAYGPFACDNFFDGMDCRAFDAVVTMFDAQCAEAHRLASNSETVTLASGIETPVAFATPEGVLKALFLTIDVDKNRKAYDAPFRNPLQKLYHERKEDGDKARFAIKKKGFNPAEHRRENVTFVTQKTVEKPAAE